MMLQFDYLKKLSDNYISRQSLFIVPLHSFPWQIYIKKLLVPQAELFRHLTGAGHHGFLEDVSFQIIDRVFGVSRHKEGFWQFTLQSCMPEGLNARFVDH